MVEILDTHGTLLMSVGITWRASKENITLDGCREDTKEGVVNVFPDKAEKSGVREGMDGCGGDEYILDAARCTHDVGGPPAESTRELIGQLIPPRTTFQFVRSGGSCWWQCNIRMVRRWPEICEQLSHRRVNWDAEPSSHGGRQDSGVDVGRDFVCC